MGDFKSRLHSLISLQLSPRTVRVVALYACLLGLLLATFVLATTSMAQKSVTVDEYSVCPNGLAILQAGAFHIDRAATPLAKVLTAFPLLFSTAVFETDWITATSTGWDCGTHFVGKNRHSFHDYFFWARLISVLALLLTCVLCFVVARSWYGPWGGLLAAAVACFSPNLLAHGRLTTPDIFLCAAFVGWIWSQDRFYKKPGVGTASVLGLCLGLAALAKFTGLLFIVLSFVNLLLCWLYARWFQRKAWFAADYQLDKKTLVYLMLACLWAILLINGAMLFDATGSSLGAHTYQSSFFQWLQSWLPAWLPIPLPQHYWLGLDAQLGDAGYPAYLLGEFNQEGFVYYYVVAWLVKTPLAHMLLLVVALIVGKRLRQRELPLVGACGFLVLFFSLVGHKNIGIRYILFVYPACAILIGRLLARIPTIRWKKVALRVCVGFSLVWLCMTTLLIWPDYLPFFNVGVGGPAHGHEYLLDSNLDWGQDLLALKRYMDSQGIDSVDLAYWGRIRPRLYGLDYQNLYQGVSQRYVAISANFLWGRMYYMNGTTFWPTDERMFLAYRNYKPKAVIGHTIYVFDLLQPDLTKS